MKKIQTAWLFIASVHLLALLIMSLQRLGLLVSQQAHWLGTVPKAWVAESVLRGLWFDNVIASYCSLLPLVILSLGALFTRFNLRLLYFFLGYYVLVYSIVFGIGMANIPYFAYFYKHLNSSILVWKEEGGVALSMIFSELSYYLYILAFLLTVFSFTWIVLRLLKRLLQVRSKLLHYPRDLTCLLLSLVLIGLCFLGIRGRLGYNPIKTSQAYFCSNSFINQAGINPTFYLLRDLIESKKAYYQAESLVDLQLAFPLVQEALHATQNPEDYYPLLRQVEGRNPVPIPNVVVVFMESMSSVFLGMKENGKELTPFLNALRQRSYYFSNFYASGTHTNHGVLAGLYGLPALFDKNMMKNVDIPLCQGLPNTLQEKGYQTSFFVTHEAQYDNMNAFLLENGIDRVYAQEDYPKEKIRNSFGVADDYLFEYALQTLSKEYTTRQPFFATLLTVSNHPPYVVPTDFQAVSSDPQLQIVAFADEAIAHFMAEAEKQDWYQSTYFVFLGDHGKIVGEQPFAMPLSYHHVPLFIYSKEIETKAQKFSGLMTQVDVFPTVMGLLGLDYTNNTLGTDVLTTERKYSYFSSDNALGCVDEHYFYSYQFKEQVELLYRLQPPSPIAIEGVYRTKADSMRTYAASMLRVTDNLLSSGQTRVQNKPSSSLSR